jgi:hypothetical protein
MQYWDIQETHVLGTLERRALPVTTTFATARDVIRPNYALSILTTFVVNTDHILDLRSKARQRLLAYYFTNPAARLHLRDLAGRLRIDPSNLSRELRRLEREGLFRSEVSGWQKYFQLNRGFSCSPRCEAPSRRRLARRP